MTGTRATPDGDWSGADQPDEDWPAEDWPDEDWPDDRDRPPGNPVPARMIGAGAGGMPGDARRRARRIVGLAVTAVVALGLGAGAVAIFKSATASPAPPGSASSAQTPGNSIGSGAPGGSATMSLTMLGPVVAVSRSSVTVGGPGRSVTATVTSATRFSGSVRRLGDVRVGDSVVAQIVLSGGVARLVSLQDPASQP